jgi:hypothetical protein
MAIDSASTVSAVGCTSVRLSLYRGQRQGRVVGGLVRGRLQQSRVLSICGTQAVDGDVLVVRVRSLPAASGEVKALDSGSAVRLVQGE